MNRLRLITAAPMCIGAAVAVAIAAWFFAPRDDAALPAPVVQQSSKSADDDPAAHIIGARAVPDPIDLNQIDSTALDEALKQVPISD